MFLERICGEEDLLHFQWITATTDQDTTTVYLDPVVYLRRTETCSAVWTIAEISTLGKLALQDEI